MKSALILLFLISGLLPLRAKASAVAYLSKDSKTITLTSHLYFYGEAASPDVVRRSLDEINLYWNGQSHTDSTILSLWGYLGQQRLDFKMWVTGELISTPDALLRIQNHPAIGENFIKVQSEASDPRQPHSYMAKICGSTGTWYLADDLGNSTTTAHEFGHALCLTHPFSADIRNRGQPWIMVPRNSLVAAIYQIDPHAKPGKPGGSINPYLRKVLQTDLDSFYWESLQFDAEGKANIGDAAQMESKESQRVE